MRCVDAPSRDQLTTNGLVSISNYASRRELAASPTPRPQADRAFSLMSMVARAPKGTYPLSVCIAACRRARESGGGGPTLALRRQNFSILPLVEVFLFQGSCHST